MPPVRKNLIAGSKINILRCNHYDVKGQTIGVYLHRMEKEGGIAVEVNGSFQDAYDRKMTEGKQTVFVADGEYEVL
jgi:hypothetical protein